MPGSGCLRHARPSRCSRHGLGALVERLEELADRPPHLGAAAEPGPGEPDLADQLVADVDRHQVAREAAVVPPQQHRLDVGLDRVDDRVGRGQVGPGGQCRATTRSRRRVRGRRPAAPRCRSAGRRRPGRPGSCSASHWASVTRRSVDPTDVLPDAAVATATRPARPEQQVARPAHAQQPVVRAGRPRGRAARRCRRRRTRSAPRARPPAAASGRRPGAARRGRSRGRSGGDGDLPGARLGQQRQRPQRLAAARRRRGRPGARRTTSRRRR